MENRPAIDLVILTGDLGSGKTTLLVDLLRQEAGADTGVIVNEVGAVGVDGIVVEQEGDTSPMTLLANGCVCCSLRSSLVHTISAMLDAPRQQGCGPLRRIVLETSGLSRPGPIIASLADPELAGRGVRVNVLGTYDCTGMPREPSDEACAQLAAAQRIVFTKLDRCADAHAGPRLEQHIQRHRDRIFGMNPIVELIDTDNRAAAVARAFAPAEPVDATTLGLRALRTGMGPALRHPRVHVMAGEVRGGVTWDEIARWLDDLAGYCGERLLRVKGIVPVSDCGDPILVQSVGTTFSAPRRLRAAVQRNDIFVAITRDVMADDINAMWPDAPVRLRER
jgi:G3E family GTPase